MFSAVFRVAILSAVSLAVSPAIAVQITTTGGVDNPVVILRDLTVYRDTFVQSYDDNLVQLSNGTSVRWDAIQSAAVGGELREEFNRRLAGIGQPMFRLKVRLANRDWWSISEIAEPLYGAALVQNREDENGPGFQLDSTTRYLIYVATMYGRLEAGNREAAVAPFLAAIRLQDAVERADPQSVILSQEQLTGDRVFLSLLPVWFDNRAARETLFELNQLVTDGRIVNSPLVALYRISLALAGGELESAESIMQSEPEIPAAWKPVMQAWLQLKQGRPGEAQRTLADAESFSPPVRVTALFLSGTAGEEEAASSSSLVTLLTIPALFGDRFPVMSGAALYEAARISGESGIAKQQAILLEELLRRYPNTYHGRKAVADEK